MNKEPQLILASASTRRIQLLRQMGLNFTVQPASLDEAVQTGESPRNYTMRLAAAKAKSVWLGSEQSLPVLGADTIVSLDGKILGKPVDNDHAVSMLMSLSDRKHEVVTAISVECTQGQQTCAVNSEVEFVVLSRTQCEAYCCSGESADKAGAYAIQGLAGSFVRRLSGSYSAVVGLPLCETAELLSAAGIQLPVYRGISVQYE